MSSTDKISVHNVSAEDMLVDSKTFCMLPFVHTHLTPDGKNLPCCIGDMGEAHKTARKDVGLEGMINSDFMKQLRLDMINGVRSEICKTCYKTEETNSGMYSFRNTANEKWGKFFAESISDTTGTGHLLNFKMRYFDFRLSIACNFKCRSCNSGYSSLWLAEDAKQGIPGTVDSYPERNDALLEDILEHIPYIEEAYFAGGEPLVDDYHYMILEEFIRAGRTDIRLNYNTNLSRLEYKHYDVLDLWSKFDNPVDVYSSIDHYGERAEYIRNGTKWDKVENNIKRLLLEPNVNLQISTTVTLLNYLTLDEFYLYMLKNGLMPGGDWQLNPVFNPAYLSAINLPEEYKQKGRQAIQNIIDFVTSDHYIIDRFRRRTFDFEHTINNISNFPDLVEAQQGRWPELKEEFVKETGRLDKMRGENFSETFPELKGLYQ